MSCDFDDNRYDRMKYNRCGKSGLRLSALSLGLWHNFGATAPLDDQKRLLTAAFNLGITHFDLANNYGPPAGSAEENFGRIMRDCFRGFRDELVISSKAGYYMWPGPYGEWGSKKYLTASIDQSLKRCGLDYFDIFYHHRPDPDTPLEETMGALAQIVRQGKALYVGVSNYRSEQTREAYKILKSMGVTLLIHQPRYSMLDRWVEDGLLNTLDECGMGSAVFSPLAQGLLTDKYLTGIPRDSRAAGHSVFLTESSVTPEAVEKARKLNEIAKRRGQSLAQMALAWVLRRDTVTSVIIGARTPEQIKENCGALENLMFTQEELGEIDAVLA